MNLYLLTQNDNNNYDTYDSCVVSAESEEDAVSLHPSGEECEIDYDGHSTWTIQTRVKCELIGTSNYDVRKVVCASFNAG